MVIRNRKTIIVHGQCCKKDGNCNSMCLELKDVNEAKYLGFNIDKHWKHDIHIQRLITKLKQILPKLYKLRNLLNKENKLIIYNAWIASHLRYGIEVYGFATCDLIQKLQRIQNKAVKILFGYGHNLSTKEIFKKEKILNVIQLRDYTVMLKRFFVEKISYESLKLKRPNRHSKTMLPTAMCRNSYGTKCQDFYSPYIFNQLSESFVTIQSFSELKRSLKNWYFK